MSATDPAAGAAAVPGAPVRRYRALIVDDEVLARDNVRLCLKDAGDVEVAGECASGPQAVEAIRNLDPDLVFLDIQMPEFDGFRVIEEVGAERMPVVIFVTAYDEHALHAFDVHAVDYVLKPFDNARFQTALDRARELLRARESRDIGQRLHSLVAALRGEVSPGEAAVGAAGGAGYAHRLTVRHDERIHFVAVKDVDWFEAADGQVRVHAGKGAYVMRTTLSALTEQLDPKVFSRIHRSVVVNVERVREVQPWFGGDYVAILQDGRQLRVSRTYRDQFLKPLQ